MLKRNIEILDILLMIVSLLLAIIVPFKLFLFSYAVLGPLHYLTEINWLKEHDFFIKKFKKWHLLFFLIIGLLISLYPLLNLLDIEINDVLKNILYHIGNYTDILVITTFVFSICLVFFKRTKQLLTALFFSIIIGIGLSLLFPKYSFIVGLFTLTIIHVYFFTLIFVINGAFKTNSFLSIFSAMLLIVTPILIVFIDINLENYTTTDKINSSLSKSGLKSINYYISKIFSSSIEYDSLINSKIGIKSQIFIAFVYTYHYLNWFIKTSVIGWKKAISKRKMTIIIFAWLASISIYIYDYYTGSIILLFMSVIHVLLEFPLNIKSFNLLQINIKALFKN